MPRAGLHFRPLLSTAATPTQTFDFWLILGPLLIFIARIGDVSIGTVRNIYTIRGYRKISFFLGFFESIIFISAISGVLAGISSGEGGLEKWLKIMGYAGGFASGIFVGLTIESWIASGWQVVRVIAKDAPELDDAIRAAGWGVTEVLTEGRDGPGRLLFIVSKRRKTKKLLDVVHAHAPNSFITVDPAGRVIGGMANPSAAAAIRK